MTILRALAAAFARYTRIPVPLGAADDQRYAMAAFPAVGAVIGLLFCAVYAVGQRFALPETAVALLMAAVPILVTGGFHLDGFMDVSDAISSYRSREEKLRILKDPHVGAFAVIRLVAFLMIAFAALLIILRGRGDILPGSDFAEGMRGIGVPGAGFFLVRALCGLTVLHMKPAKSDGMLAEETREANVARRRNHILLVVQMAAILVLMFLLDRSFAVAAVIASVVALLWYRHLTQRQFGGTTGDTAGWFITVCEGLIAVACAVAAVLF